jgi:hypothetical protein
MPPRTSQAVLVIGSKKTTISRSVPIGRAIRRFWTVAHPKALTEAHKRWPGYVFEQWNGGE